MNVMQGPYYNLNYKFLYFAGQWPYLNKWQKFVRNSFTLIFIFSMNIPMLLGLFNTLGDLSLLIECLSPLVIISISTMMAINFIIIGKKLSVLLEKIEQDWIKWSNEPEIEIIKKFANDGKKLRMTYGVTLLGVTVSFLTLPALPQIFDVILPLNESRPHPPLYVTDYKFIDGEKYFLPIFLHNYICTIFTIVNFINADMVVMGFFQHACGIFAAMGSKLRNLANDQFSPNRNHSLRKKIDSDIIFCVKQHQELITFLEIIHKCFSNMFLVIVVLNMLIISVTGAKLVLKMENLADVFRFTVETFGQVVHIFFITIPCQQLIDHSMNLSQLVYNSNWYLLPVQSRKTLLMVMRRSSEPLEFIAGKLYTYSMMNFGMVIKTSISYFTVLISLQ